MWLSLTMASALSAMLPSSRFTAHTYTRFSGLLAYKSESCACKFVFTTIHFHNPPSLHVRTAHHRLQATRLTPSSMPSDLSDASTENPLESRLSHIWTASCSSALICVCKCAHVWVCVSGSTTRLSKLTRFVFPMRSRFMFLLYLSLSLCVHTHAHATYTHTHTHNHTHIRHISLSPSSTRVASLSSRLRRREAKRWCRPRKWVPWSSPRWRSAWVLHLTSFIPFECVYECLWSQDWEKEE